MPQFSLLHHARVEFCGLPWTKTCAVWLMCIAAVAAASAADQPTGVLLAEQGKAVLPVVVSEQASERTRTVAAELAEYLERITGGPFEVITGDGSRGIVLGTIAEFPDPTLQQPLEIRNQFDGREAFAIRTDAERLRLIGATDLGTSHAAFALLEHFGCRWFFPAPEWEVIPSQPTLRALVHDTQRPALLARRIWYGHGLFAEPSPPSGRLSPAEEYAAWARHNRMAQSFTINCGHAWQSIIDDNRTVFEAHPEYLALVDGKRGGEQLCVSNPAVRELAIRWALNFLATHPAADMVSMEPSDGDGQCECGECAKLGTISDRVFGLANDVARAVHRDYPDKLVGLYAYNEHCEPPSFALEPHVYVQITAGFIRGRYSFDELMQLWPERCQNLGVYEYFSVWLWDFDRLPGGRAADVGYLREQIPRYVSRGATSLDCESGNNWGPHGRGYYIANRLMWNPEADTSALLNDFYEAAFGPAAKPMQRYYERFDPSNKPLLSEHLLALGFRDVEEASALAADRPEVQARLDHIKQYLRYVHLRWMADRAADKEQQKQLTLAALTHAYRTRFSYMNHWEAIRQSWTSQAAEKFDEPSWAFNSPTGTPPWAIDRPYTAAETATAFREGLAHFQPDSITEEQFSRELIPAKFSAPAVAALSSQAYQGTVQYALYSRAGEALALEVTPGTIAWYRDRPAARWKLTSAAGAEVASGSLPLDGKPHPLELKVPHEGLYFFRLDDSAAGWKIEVAAGRSASVVLAPAEGFAHAGWMQPMYFYVPQGTRELQYYWSGGPHWVHGPEGGKLQQVKSSGVFVKIPVPAGADGKTWHFSELALGHLWFFNAPNYLAASPEALLIPRELAERDQIAASQDQ